MTINLDPIYKSNSQLFKALVYDTDGVTELTPSSCVCSVWDAAHTAVITDQAGTVGSGYAQYNWAGSATAGMYEAVLTVTISVGVVKSEHFLVEVREKPPAFTTDVSTDTGKVRMLIPDRDQENAFFADDEITALLSMNDSNVRRTAADALDIMASNEAYVQKQISLLELSTNGPAVAAALRERADKLRDLADADEAGEDGGAFDWAETVQNDFQMRERVWKQALRDSD